MRALERKISKMKVLNDDALSKLYVAEKLYTNKTLLLETAIMETSIALKQKALKAPYQDRLNLLYDGTMSIKGILDTFDENQFRKIAALIKANASTHQILEDPLRKMEEAIAGQFGIFYNIGEMRKNLFAHNAYYYEILNDIEKSYKTILNLVKRTINKWYKFITAKALVITLLVLTVVALITFFIIKTDFHKGQTPTEAIQIKAQKSTEKVKEIYDKTVTFGEKVSDFSGLVTKTVGLIPQLLFLVTIAIWILRQFFIQNKKTSKKLSSFVYKLTELRRLVKEQT